MLLDWCTQFVVARFTEIKSCFGRKCSLYERMCVYDPAERVESNLHRENWRQFPRNFSFATKTFIISHGITSFKRTFHTDIIYSERKSDSHSAKHTHTTHKLTKKYETFKCYLKEVKAKNHRNIFDRIVFVAWMHSLIFSVWSFTDGGRLNR